MSFNLNATLDFAVPTILSGMWAAWLRRPIRRQQRSLRQIEERTVQLQHNGGSHVADYARDARDNSERILEQLGRTDRRLDGLRETLDAHMSRSVIVEREIRGELKALAKRRHAA